MWPISYIAFWCRSERLGRIGFLFLTFLVVFSSCLSSPELQERMKTNGYDDHMKPDITSTTGATSGEPILYEMFQVGCFSWRQHLEAELWMQINR